MTQATDASADIPPEELERPAPTRADTEEAEKLPPKAGSNEARNEERKTPPSRNRGVTDV